MLGLISLSDEERPPTNFGLLPPRSHRPIDLVVSMLIPFDHLFRKYAVKTDQVLHLGANTGQEAEAYDEQGISRVIWVEALLEVWVKLRQHIVRFPGHTALLACLSDKDGEEVTFNVASNDSQSSSFLEFGTHSKEHPTVKFERIVEMTTVRLDTLLDRENIKIQMNGFLNADLQGAELLALKGMGDLLGRFRYAYIEVNEKELYQGCPLVGEIDDYLASFGFEGKEVKMTGAGWGDKFYMRRD